MCWVFISLFVITVLQFGICGADLLMGISCIGRLIFMLRRIGSVVPYKVSIGFEVAHLFFTFLGIIFSKAGVDWVHILLTILFSAVVCLIYVVDDQFYLYVVVDEEEDVENNETYKD